LSLAIKAAIFAALVAAIPLSNQNFHGRVVTLPEILSAFFSAALFSDARTE
jgi:hypothetical protein